MALCVPTKDLSLDEILNYARTKSREELAELYAHLSKPYRQLLRKMRGNTWMTDADIPQKTLPRFPIFGAVEEHTRAIYSRFERKVIAIKGSGNYKYSVQPIRYDRSAALETRKTWGADRIGYAARQFIGALNMHQIIPHSTLIPLSVKRLCAVVSEADIEEIVTYNKRLQTGDRFPWYVLKQLCCFVYIDTASHQRISEQKFLMEGLPSSFFNLAQHLAKFHTAGITFTQGINGGRYSSLALQNVTSKIHFLDLDTITTPDLDRTQSVENFFGDLIYAGVIIASRVRGKPYDDLKIATWKRLHQIVSVHKGQSKYISTNTINAVYFFLRQYLEAMNIQEEWIGETNYCETVRFHDNTLQTGGSYAPVMVLDYVLQQMLKRRFEEIIKIKYRIKNKL